MMNKQPVIVICGPTASGKSATSIRVAQAISGEIISADSMQIYRGMDIGTAKVTHEEQQMVKHHLIDCCDPGEYFSVAQFKKLATQAILDIQSRGHVPIICGGTGQYISALVDGIDFVEIKTDPHLRENLNSRAEKEGLEQLFFELQQVDPQAAAVIKPRDQKRIVRALEVYLQTGKCQSLHQAESRLNGPDFDFQIFCLTHDRPVLYERINRRVQEMFDAGLVDEVKDLIGQTSQPEDSSRDTDEEHPGLIQSTAWQAIGYKEVLAYIRGEQSEQSAADMIAQASRRYAKRQLTWFRRFENAVWLTNLTPEQAATEIVSIWNKLE